MFPLNINAGNFGTLYSFAKPHIGTNTDGCEPRTGLITAGNFSITATNAANPVAARQFYIQTPAQ